MEAYGRDWKKGSELVGTRDHRAIASHAQKYLIKLCLAGKPLPAAIARTGAGYTLSGAMLDPYSAAARSYGFKPELLLREWLWFFLWAGWGWGGGWSGMAWWRRGGVRRRLCVGSGGEGVFSGARYVVLG